MLELTTINQEILNTKDRITIDLIKDGQEFLEQFDINRNLMLDSVSIVYRFLRLNKKIPHNLYKFFIAAYYIVSRHPKAFPVHESKKRFCRQFGLQPSSLDYSVEKIIGVLNYIKILDDKNYPYFIDIKIDIGFKLCRNIIKVEIDRAMMNFLLYNQPFNSQIFTEDLINKIIFEMKVFPEELFRQFFEIVFDIVENSLCEYYDYVRLQESHFI